MGVVFIHAPENMTCVGWFGLVFMKIDKPNRTNVFFKTEPKRTEPKCCVGSFAPPISGSCKNKERIYTVI